MRLCAFSKSEILKGQILAECPLGLTKAESEKCPCKTRKYHVPPADLRVLACTFPETWRGEPIRNPEALAKTLKIDRKATNRERSLEQMATATAGEPQDNERGKKGETAHATSGGLTVYSRISDPMDFIAKMGVTIYDSKMFGCVNAAQGRMLAFAFLVRGVDPFEFRARHHLIGGNVTMASEAMLADLRTDCGGTHRIITRTPDKAAIEIAIGKQKQLFEFTWAEARLEDYVYNSAANDGKIPKSLQDGSPNQLALKDNWKTPRRRMQMLWARVVSDAVGAMAPEVSGGKLTPEELGVLAADATAEKSLSTAPEEVAAAAGEAGEVIDGDFTVTKDESTGAAEAAAAPASDASLRQKPESPPFEPTGPAGDADKPAQAMTDQPPSGAEQRKALLLELKALKTELLTPEQYAKVIDSKGVKSAFELDLPQLEKLVSALRTRKAKQAGTDALSQWANGAVQPKAAEGGQPGN